MVVGKFSVKKGMPIVEKKLADGLATFLVLELGEGEDFYQVETRVCGRVISSIVESDDWIGRGRFRCIHNPDKLYRFEWVWEEDGVGYLAAFVLAKDVGRLISESEKLAGNDGNGYGFDPLTDSETFQLTTEVFIYSPDHIPILEMAKLVKKKVRVILVTTKEVLVGIEGTG